jgi:acetyl-CoA C-acetyltransferase
VPAVKKALKRADLPLDKIDMIELNEAFASQAISNVRELKLDMAKTNVHGGGISIGHPIGCTGARLIVTLMHQMPRLGMKYGLATMCIGGGQGMAMVVEREA